MAPFFKKLSPLTLAALLVAGCAGQAPRLEPPPIAATRPAESADDPAFTAWLADFRAEALRKGLKPETLDIALAGLRPIPRVLELDRRQPEFSLSFDGYLSRVVKPARIERGRAELAAHRDLFRAVSQRYGVPPEQIAAMWGIESGFGASMGDFQLVPALATLAYDGRRSAFFRGELQNALVIVDNGMVPLDKLKGSWAGAMGQCQFMPSTYLKYARSWSGGGSPDIWEETADVLASTANYLSQLGWKADQRWGYAVKLPKGGVPPSLMGLEIRRSLGVWNKRGVRLANGGKLPPGEAGYSLIRADDGTDSGDRPGPAYLVGDNFRVLMTWNRSTFFALAAGTLADRLAGR